MDKGDSQASHNIKVKTNTYKRLRLYQAKMMIDSGGEEKYSMDQVIGALLDFLETADITLEEKES